MPTADEVADLLDQAHDELLVRGWCQNAATNGEGNVCLMGAVGVCVGADLGRFIAGSAAGEDLFLLATDAIQRKGGSAQWNDKPERTIDDVLDLLRVTSKALRNGELEVA